MFNKKKFKAKLILLGLSLKDVAKSLNLNVSTLYRKMNGDSDFYRNEIQNLSVLLDLDSKEIKDIFFSE